MHELAIAQSVFEKVQLRMQEDGYRRVTAVGMRIGALTDVVPEALTFGFEVVTRDTPLDGVELVIERVPIKAHCNGCGGDFDVDTFVFVCPSCRGTDVRMTQGDELEIHFLRVEDDEDEAGNGDAS